jgi:tetratricopeptide (TPR) repeat protein
MHNIISSNGLGIRSFDHSVVHLEGENEEVTQAITDNDSYELYASQASFPQYLHWNLIQDDFNEPGDPMVKYAGNDAYLDVRNNCWGNTFDPLLDLEPSGCYNWNPVWLCLNGSGSGTGSGAEELYLEARENIESEYYSAAKADFEQIVDEYPETEFAKAAMKELYPLEELTGNNYTSLKEYYNTHTAIQGNPELIKLADFLANFCDIKLENWQTAITWFEDVVENPESMEDSIFAIIDMGYTYWLMENSGLKSTYTGRMAHYKFSSREEFEDNRDFLLSLLPGDQMSETMKQSLGTLKTGELLQNVPNPFNGTTQIWFKLSEESNVRITIFDYTGKEVSAINPGLLASGNHSVEFNSANLSSGIYFYCLEVNGVLSDSKKMTVMK